ncbi:DUF2851 domain-containing protein [Christiangramia fulva]|uniref:DUF2851 domain-containing protein n=1 Tax=Christiangramia fulva TaxID=2126553 RepID=A0A2R3Z647_9FLAO|nr:DUF2851 family protein [Christiangramia fulva]AVR45735.1 DUF2851 domain-containing protein [Christiangramia fulva]
MQEDFLSYIWKFRKFDFLNARTSDGRVLEIINPGMENVDSGPDFFSAQLRIGEQLWAGNVEIHIKSSDWYFHGHETDPAYDNVILHVVWEDDAEIFRRDNSVIPSISLKSYTPAKTFKNFQHLLEVPHLQLNCEEDLSTITALAKEHWLESLYFERLESKSEAIFKLLEKTGNDWEEVLFQSLSRSFGLKVNAEAFESIARSIEFKIFRKIKDQQSKEAILLGQAQLFSGEDKYAKELEEIYEFLKMKYSLKPSEILPKFFRLRPDNFPTLRLTQLAAVYSEKPGLFNALTNCQNLFDFYELFKTGPSEYWKTHYNFGTQHPPRNKKLSKSFINLLLINCVIPILYCYYKYLGEDRNDFLFDLISAIPAEENSVVSIFKKLNSSMGKNAMQSQALLQLKNNYCDQNRCLKCEWGAQILQK